MRNLIGFLVKIAPLLLFIFFETIAVVMMVQRSTYHNYVITSSANVMAGGVYEATNSVTSYFSLDTDNEQLAIENSNLKNEIETLKAMIADSLDSIKSEPQISYIPAKVIGGSVNKLDNYLTLDKGTDDGVRPDMGVVCGDGVVGIVVTASAHFSSVLPIINSESKISCRLDSSKSLGSLIWHGFSPSYAHLEEVPRHIVVTKGEKVYTSGFSYIFPEGVPVGTVDDVELKDSDSFYKIKVKLNTSFYTISYVNVVNFSRMDELKQLNTEVKANGQSH